MVITTIMVKVDTAILMAETITIILILAQIIINTTIVGFEDITIIILAKPEKLELLEVMSELFLAIST